MELVVPSGHLGLKVAGSVASGTFHPHPCPLSPLHAHLSQREKGQLLVSEMLFFSFNTKGTLELAKQVSSLPLANYNLLRYICK